MIESIQIKDVATYGSTPEVLIGLSKLNFLFGSNGSGKTTITRIIANERDFPSCEVKWKGGAKLEPMVYNRDFVAHNFNQSSELMVADYLWIILRRSGSFIWFTRVGFSRQCLGNPTRRIFVKGGYEESYHQRQRG